MRGKKLLELPLFCCQPYAMNMVRSTFELLCQNFATPKVSRRLEQLKVAIHLRCNPMTYTKSSLQEIGNTSNSDFDFLKSEFNYNLLCKFQDLIL
jgi:hypothetical protein